MPFGFKIRGWGFVVEVAAGFGDEILENFWNTTKNEGSSNLKTVLEVGIGGAALAAGSSKSALIVTRFAGVISKATPNLLFF
jgi:hypothetical protein